MFHGMLIFITFASVTSMHFFQFSSVRLALFATIVHVPMKPGYEASLDQEDGTAEINL